MAKKYTTFNLQPEELLAFPTLYWLKQFSLLGQHKNTETDIKYYAFMLQWEKDNTYHMYLAEMRNFCRIRSWTLNSQVVHGKTDSLTKPFQRVDVSNNCFVRQTYKIIFLVKYSLYLFIFR